MNTNMETALEKPISASISEALLKIKKDPSEKVGLDLSDIAKKLSEKKFGKQRR